MAKPADIKSVIQSIENQTDIVNALLRETLNWPITNEIEELGDITYDWSAEELNAQGLEKKLLGGCVWQIPPLQQQQPWGIFLVQFDNDKIYRSVLRQVLRGLVPNRRRDPHRMSWHHRARAISSYFRKTYSAVLKRRGKSGCPSWLPLNVDRMYLASSRMMP